MRDYIEREAAIESFHENLDGGYVLTNDAQTTHILQSIPAADVRPVVRGKWIKINGLIACSVCKEYPPLIYHNFCPNCGADMRIPLRKVDV